MRDSTPSLPYTMTTASASTLTSVRDRDRHHPLSRLGTTLSKAALHSTPALFSINMGTGISSILLYKFPYPAQWLEYLGIIIFVLNVVIFFILLALTITRFILYKGLWATLSTHTLAGMYWGAFPMGFVTIVNMVCFVCAKAWGKHWAYLALGMWWIDIILAVLVSLGMVFLMFTRQQHTQQTLAPTWLLPIVACVVAAASGSVVTEALTPHNPNLARATLLTSYIVWGLGVPLAMMVIVLVFYRFALDGPPEPHQIGSIFLPLGPCGQGAYGIINMGVVARNLAYGGTSFIPSITGVEALRIADTMYAGGLIAGLVLWGLGLAWYLLGMGMLIDQVRKRWSVLGSGFTLGLWGLTFPIGVFGTATASLGHEFNSTALKVIASVLAVQVVLTWLYVSCWTVIKVAKGALMAIEAEEGEVARRWEGREKV